jgi:hypothetical protein
MSITLFFISILLRVAFTRYTSKGGCWLILTDITSVDKLFQQKDVMAIGSSLSPIVSNTYMDHFEKLSLDSTQQTIAVAPVCWWGNCGLASWPRAVREFPQPPLSQNFTENPTYTDWYLNIKYNLPPHAKRGLIQSFHNRASRICHERQDVFDEISSLRRDLQRNSYRQGFIDSVSNSNDNSRPSRG